MPVVDGKGLQKSRLEQVLLQRRQVAELKAGVLQIRPQHDASHA
jgi:hypothetical protein